MKLKKLTLPHTYFIPPDLIDNWLTVCAVLIDGKIYWGAAARNFNDSDNRKLGKLIAYGRATSPRTRKEKPEFQFYWDTYNLEGYITDAERILLHKQI